MNGAAPGRYAVVRARLRVATREGLARVADRDLSLLAAGLTFYAGVAVVPSLLVAVWGATALVGGHHVDQLAGSLAHALPPEMGAPAVARSLVRRGADLSLLTALLALLPASLYGEGLRRSLGSIAGRRERLPGWRGRAGVVPLVLLTPFLVLGVLLATPRIAQLVTAGGGQTLLGIWLAFLVDWLAVSPVLAYVYAAVTPAGLPVRWALLAGFTVGSFVAGFAEGFVLFLSLPLDLGAPFGGADVVGAMVAVGLWLWVLHWLVLLGYAVTLSLPDFSSGELPAGG